MTIKFSSEEFQIVRSIIKSINMKEVTLGFNSLFTEEAKNADGNFGFVNPISNEIEIRIDKETSIKILNCGNDLVKPFISMWKENNPLKIISMIKNLKEYAKKYE